MPFRRNVSRPGKALIRLETQTNPDRQPDGLRTLRITNPDLSCSSGDAQAKSVPRSVLPPCRCGLILDSL
jgi:hypothetical protein